MNNTIDWNTSLIDATSNWKLCFISLIPFSCCVIQGVAIQEATLNSAAYHCLLGLIPILGPGLNRGTIRARYRIKGSILQDHLTSLLCCLASTQEYLEVQYRETRMRPKPHMS